MTDLFLQQAINTTMDAAKEKEGCACPICGQFVKVYRRKITSTMARQLLEINRINKEWVHTKEVVLGGSGAGDFSKLAYWGLIEKMQHNVGEDGKKSSGFWRLTPMGVSFCHRNCRVDEYLFIYNNEVQGRSDERIDIVDALTNKFDYVDLMNNNG